MFKDSWFEYTWYTHSSKYWVKYSMQWQYSHKKRGLHKKQCFPCIVNIHLLWTQRHPVCRWFPRFIFYSLLLFLGTIQAVIRLFPSVTIHLDSWTFTYFGMHPYSGSNITKRLFTLIFFSVKIEADIEYNVLFVISMSHTMVWRFIWRSINQQPNKTSIILVNGADKQTM